ncbi:FtsX-like permease family protein [Novosphingobium sp.]|uniref:FtsX-like permease family protein n=1 Tax=Novosphingobium sp. TaxID=1874826 RepID=UPI0035AF7B92
MSKLPPLTVKLLRDVWRLRAQALAIALVMAAGVGMVVASYGMMRSLEATRTAYYDRYALADAWVPLRRAPDSLGRELARLPGIAALETRVTAAATLDIPGVAEPASARLHSLPVSINRLVLRSGRMPQEGRGNEVVVSEMFARAARLSLGDTLPALVYGKRIDLKIVGTALSPEYVYAVAPGQIFPDNRRFGIVWMARKPLAGLLDMRGGFNEAVVRLTPGTSVEEAIRRIDNASSHYGPTGAYGRDLQTSDRFLTNEVDQLKTTVEILPPIFLGVAAFLLNILLARLVDTEREVIGLLKAFGYRSGAIMRHYASLALLLSAGGVLAGWVLGAWMGRGMTAMYQDYFVFPFLNFVAGADIYFGAAALALLAVLAGAASAVWRAQRLAPAEAMRPPAPARFSSRGVGDRFVRLFPDEPSRMILRGFVRRPLRSAASVLGLAMALALYVASASSTDNVDKMIALAFERGQRADLAVAFAEPRDGHVVRELESLPGVQKVETYRSVAAELSHGPYHEREALLGLPQGADLMRMVTLDDQVIQPPREGAIVSSQLARKLDLNVGDRIDVAVTEGERQRFSLPVVQVIDVPLGASVVVERGALARHLREGDVASGAYLLADPAQSGALYAALKRTPMVAAVNVAEAAVRGIRETVAQNMGIVTLFNTIFAMLIVAGVSYTGARISLSERARDLASMRVLGFRKVEAGFVLVGEQALLTLAALPLGLGLGMALSRYIAASFSSDMFMIPYAVSARTLAEGVVVVAFASAATTWLIRRSADRLDLIRALKTRE